MKPGHLAVEKLCQRIVATIPDAVVFADGEGRIQLWNAGAESIFGYSADEAIGQTLDIIIPGKLRKRHWDGYRRVMETGASRYGVELLKVPAIRKGGERLSVEFSIALVPDAAGRPAGVAAILRDVIERWNHERELHERIRQLETRETTA